MKKGFTLIELLVVISIIGLLSSVVLSALNTARTKGADSAIKSNLANARAEAAIFYDTPQTYEGVCATTGANIIGDNMVAVTTILGSGTYAAGDTVNVSATVPACHDAVGGWAAASATKSGTPAAWCVDSTGVSQAALLTVLDTDGDVTCN